VRTLSTSFSAACLAAIQVISVPAFAKAPPSKAPASTAAAPPAAPAAAPASAPLIVANNPGTAGDAIFLKDGSVLRGTLVELLPGDHCTLQLPTGQTATVQWGVILRVERAAAVSSTIVVPSVSVVVTAPASSGAMVMVHMDGDMVNLEQRNEANRGWTVVCTSPCDKSLPLESTYRLTGSGKTNSRPFLLEGKAGDHVILNVEAGSSGGLGGGIALTAIGGPILLIGLLVIAVGASVASSNTYSAQNGSGIEVAGVVISAVGLAGIIPGIIMITGNARTKETQQTGTTSRAQANVPTRAVWADEAKNSHGPAMPALPSITLFSGSF
jgi:hypothetical protein